MKLVQVENRSGFRFYVNGKQVSEEEFDITISQKLVYHKMPSLSGRSEKTRYGSKTTWEFEE